jgi:hypothetical protein
MRAMSFEPDILVWLNKQSGDEERAQRKILERKIFELMVHTPSHESRPETLSRGLAEAIAEYVAYGICGNVYEREKND